MQRTIAVRLMPIIGAAHALAAPGITTTDVDLRAGPGTDAKVLVAAAVPLDVVKAGRCAEAHTSVSAAERSAAAEAKGWDRSVAALAAGIRPSSP